MILFTDEKFSDGIVWPCVNNASSIIIPTFNNHFYTLNKKFYKKSISPILNKREVLEAKILTLDGTIIGNESLLPNII